MTYSNEPNLNDIPWNKPNVTPFFHYSANPPIIIKLLSIKQTTDTILFQGR